jgi:GT2 family glycosyltransferase
MRTISGGIRIAVVMATHKGNPSLNRSIESFLPLLTDPIDFIFVDNGSAENLKVWVEERYPALTSIRLPGNRLFCGGYNAGMRLALEKGYEFILISNADTEVVNPAFLQEMLRVERAWPRAAFLGPEVFWRNPGMIQKTCLSFPTIWRSSLQWLPWRFMRGSWERQCQKESAVEFLNGVCVLCRGKALKEVGLLDENMGGYVEDADWSWRAQRKGWVSVFAPIPSVVHYEDTSGYEPYSLKTFLLKRNTVYWYLKIGKRQSAQSYALASATLATVKLLCAACAEERRRHRYFLKRLIRAFHGLLQREPLGEWFGPPMGPWENENEF